MSTSPSHLKLFVNIEHFQPSTPKKAVSVKHQFTSVLEAVTNQTPNAKIPGKTYATPTISPKKADPRTPAGDKVLEMDVIRSPFDFTTVTKFKPLKKPRSSKVPSAKKPFIKKVHQAIIALGDVKGSSFPAIRKYILDKHKMEDSKDFRSNVEKAIKAGVHDNRFVRVQRSVKVNPTWSGPPARKPTKKALVGKKGQSKELKDEKSAKGKSKELKGEKSTKGKSKANDSKQATAKKNSAQTKKEPAPATAKKASGQTKSKSTKKGQIDIRDMLQKKPETEEQKAQRLKRERKKAEKEQRKKEAEVAKAKEAAAKMLEKERKKAERKLKKLEEEKKAKELADRIKKRKFPMEDTILHAEDKELNVKPPASVTKPPVLPFVFQVVKRHSKASAAQHSKCDALSYDSRGLFGDLLQIYHFFKGDLNFSRGKSIVADFTLQQLIHAADEILNGKAKKMKAIPPLIVHLFVTCLNYLTTSPKIGDSPEAKQMESDLSSLRKSLSAVSWSEVCVMYMDCMERFYSSTASQDDGVLRGGFVDADYLFRLKAQHESPDLPSDLPEGYGAYLGHDRSSLYRAHFKLLKQDPWHLTAEELMALLRALTDDVIATQPEVAASLNNQEEELKEQAKVKRAADAHFRKMKLAFEGPKRKQKVEKKKEATDPNTPTQDKPVDEKKEGKDKKEDKESAEAPKEDQWTPQISKKKFVSTGFRSLPTSTTL